MIYGRHGNTRLSTRTRIKETLSSDRTKELTDDRVWNIIPRKKCPLNMIYNGEKPQGSAESLSLTLVVGFCLLRRESIQDHGNPM